MSEMIDLELKQCFSFVLNYFSLNSWLFTPLGYPSLNWARSVYPGSFVWVEWCAISENSDFFL